MRHKIITYSIFVIALYFLQGCADRKETIINQEGEALFKANCAVCHSAADSQAPQLAALKLLSKETIVATLQTGVMRNQAITLTKEEHQQLANYISTASETAFINKSLVGMCNEGNDNDYSVDNSYIGNWGMGLENKRYYAEDDLLINTKNISNLTLSWAFAFPNATRARVQPTIAGNTLFTASQHGTIYALDRRTGCIRWTFQADAEIRSALVIGRDANGNASKLYFGDFKASVYALDLKTKQLLWKVKVDAHPMATITGSLNIFEDRMYVPISSMEIVSALDPEYECCTFRGAVIALNLENGNEIWKTRTIPEVPGPQGVTSVGTTIMAPSGAPVWTTPTIDAKRRVLYFGTGENYSRPTSKTSDAIMALSLEDGQIMWVQQTLANDAWNGACVYPPYGPNCPEDTGPDADFGAPPILINDGERDLLLVGQKSGDVFALDPDNMGKIVWRRLVGRGGIMGGVHWGMASDGNTLFVPINDQGGYPIHEEQPIQPGLHALKVEDGSRIWSTIEKSRCGDTSWACGPGITAAITATPDIIYTGALDGLLKAYNSKTGQELWSYDTKREFEAVNGVDAFGGAIDSDGPVILGNQMFVNSGYARFNEQPGNVLLAFEVKN